jgi:phosphoglycolate phosphatase
VGRLLVLWDVDYTLVDSDGIGRQLYETALRELFGLPMPQSSSMSGRTDRAIALEVLTLAGVPEPEAALGPFHNLMAARAADLAVLVPQRSRVLAGAVEAMSALARLDVVQSLLTGNIRPLAEVKLGPLGLTEHLDLTVGAYGDAHAVRSELVHLARDRAAGAYGCDFAGAATVVVGDTPLDVGAALATGARAVGVATGQFTAEQLAASGAHAVLPDLADTDRTLAAILGPDRP